ncbi:hypothetical protein [Pantoea vagans]|jgi:hypothetical protein|uniref:hypothetical protein n=1 Tax=Pantoea vagans TaxID=470934 RepID=UPI00059C94AE|nr:hypothetical protein [Pantoea vagans]
MSIEVNTILTVLAVNFVCYLIAVGFDTLYKGKINLGFSRKLARDRERHDARVKAELVADLLGEWNSFPVDRSKLRALSYKAFIWLPSDIANELSKVLNMDNDAKSTREIIMMTREHIYGKKDDLDHNKTITFRLSDEEQKRRRYEPFMRQHRRK